jgi:hypothetical protein
VTVGAGPAWAGGTRTGTSSTPPGTCDPFTRFNRDNFDHPTRITNRFLPLVPGTQFVFDGRANRDGTPLDHRVVFTVTDLTKVVNGVRTRVVLDRDVDAGQLAEAELAFFAQDDNGNVWSVGEYPEEYDNGRFTGAPNTWIPGQAGAKAGIMMLAHPDLGTPPYLQGFSPNIDFLDCARVFQRGQHVCVPAGCYDHVLVTDENSPLDPASGHQRKFYASGVGNVQITAVDDPEGETLVLTRLKCLGPDALSKIRDQAFHLEHRAYQVSKVYQHTEPMRRG